MKTAAKRWTALALGLLMLLTMAGCSADLGAMLLVKKAYDAVSRVQSVSFEGDVEAKVQLRDADMEADVKAEADGCCTVSPAALKADAAVQLNGLSSQTMPVYVMWEDGAAGVYVGMSILGSTIWLSERIEISSDISSGSREDVMSFLESCNEPLVRGKEELVNGAAAIPLSLTIPGGSFTGVTVEAADGESAAELPQVEDVLLTVWLDKKSHLPVKAQADIHSPMQYLLEQYNSPAIPEMTITSMPVTVYFTGYDNVSPIVLPEGARQAAKNAA